MVPGLIKGSSSAIVHTLEPWSADETINGWDGDASRTMGKVTCSREYEACKLHFKLDSHINCNNRYIDSKDGVYILSREILASTAVR